MKKMIYMIAFAAVLTAASTADAMVNSLVTENNNLQQQKYETRKKYAKSARMLTNHCAPAGCRTVPMKRSN